MKIKKILKELQFNQDEELINIINKIKSLSIHTNKTPIAFITSKSGKCIGSLTLSDFYRAKNKKNLNTKNVMNKKFIYINKKNSENFILIKFEKFFLDNNPNIKTIPVLDENQRIIDLINYSDFKKNKIFSKVNVRPKIKYVYVKIPARISFSGGGTDFSNLINENKTYIISSTINKFIKIEINVFNNKSQFLIIKNRKINLKKKQNIKKYRLIYKILEFYNIKFGFNLKINSEFDRGSGLGGSSALTVAIVSALDTILFEKINLKHVINKSYRIERIDSKISGGWQDFYTSSYGGLCWITMNKTDIKVKKIYISKKVRENIEKNLIFFKFGKSRDSGKIQSKLQRKIKTSKNTYKNLVFKMNKITLDFKNTMKSGNLRRLGYLQNKNWLLKKKMNKDISNNDINHLYSKIIKMGAYGGKILGAGNSGYLMINANKQNQTRIAGFLNRFGFKEEKIKFSDKGLEIFKKKL